ncbi:carbohydrate ABC transporter membrane protein 2, CUT1 family [Alkalispirochaeta americana]|uniref:Carbohydrate ABC transporter membrane protein 2, CUT1 family n=1 Tax=Alkalispirochaeta americana TaxID=159291 RepID=A0A1N6Q9E7_9SPIO|nr:carbohydrate ABC transporter permease [Alkalispirochaeta americana]SIQ13145.1 carbohydrate ABC transporter membrane protein 2, CUT1 family [Alkalispirochaeta americana]
MIVQTCGSRRFLSAGRLGGYCFAGIWALLTLYPLVFSILSSFKSTDEIYYNPFALPQIWRIGNYAAAFGRHNMVLAIGNSLFFGIGATALVLVTASMAAFALARYRLRYLPWVFLFFALGIMIPIHSTLIPLVRMINRAGLANRYSSLIVLYSGFSVPLAVLIITGFMRGIPAQLEESAIIDGARPGHVLFRIVLPLSTPALATAGIITFRGIYNDLIFALLFINRPRMNTISLALLRFQGSWHIELGPVFAAVTVAIIPMIVIYMLFQERIEHGLAAGALKE